MTRTATTQRPTEVVSAPKNASVTSLTRAGADVTVVRGPMDQFIKYIVIQAIRFGTIPALLAPTLEAVFGQKQKEEDDEDKKKEEAAPAPTKFAMPKEEVQHELSNSKPIPYVLPPMVSLRLRRVGF